MVLSIDTERLPLRADENGTVRVGNTRVTLDTIVEVYKTGLYPEEIASRFPAVTLGDVYYAIAFYLQHKADVEQYIEEGNRHAEEVKRQWAEHDQQDGLRERLLSRVSGNGQNTV